MHTEPFGSFLKVSYQFGDAAAATRDEVKAFMSAADQLEVELVNLRIDFADARLEKTTLSILGYACRGVELCHAIKALIAFKSWTGLFTVTRTLLELTANSVCVSSDESVWAVLELKAVEDQVGYLTRNPQFSRDKKLLKDDMAFYAERIEDLNNEVRDRPSSAKFKKITYRIKRLQEIDEEAGLSNAPSDTWPQVYSALCQEAHSDVLSVSRRHVTGERIMAYATYDEEHVRSLVAISVALVGRLILCIRSRVEMHTAPK